MPGPPQHPGSQRSSSSSSQPTSQPPPGQGGQAPQGGSPTNEQLIQYMMISKGMNREAASEELFENPDPIKQEYAKLQQIMCSQSGQGGQSGGSSGSGG